MYSSEKYMDTSLQEQCTAVHSNAGKMHCIASSAGTFHSNAYTFQIVYFFDTPMHIVTTVHPYLSSARTVHCSAPQCNLSLQYTFNHPVQTDGSTVQSCTFTSLQWSVTAFHVVCPLQWSVVFIPIHIYFIAMHTVRTFMLPVPLECSDAIM